MAKFTALCGLSMNYYGHDLTGPVGHVFRLPDSMKEDFDRDFGYLGLTWTTEDEIASISVGGHPDLATHAAMGLAVSHTHDYSATVHTHAQSQVTSLTTDLAGKADSAHTHSYAATSHSHVDGDLPASIARDTEVTAAIVAHEASATHGGSGSIPAGIIAMWGGLLASIPSGWALCDGLNGTPDLRGLFVKGSAAGAEPGTTGGAASHAHATHASAGGHAHADHTGTRKGGTSNPATIPDGNLTHDTQGAHTHDAHSTESHEPPYYALAFIQKI